MSLEPIKLVQQQPTPCQPAEPVNEAPALLPEEDLSSVFGSESDYNSAVSIFPKDKINDDQNQEILDILSTEQDGYNGAWESMLNEDGSINFDAIEEFVENNMLNEDGSFNMDEFTKAFESGFSASNILESDAAHGAGVKVDVPYRDGGYIATLEDGTKISGNHFFPDALSITPADGEQYELYQQQTSN